MAAARLCRPGPRPPRAPRACAPRPAARHWPAWPGPASGPAPAPPPLPGSLEREPGRALCPGAPPAARGRCAGRAPGSEGAVGPSPGGARPEPRWRPWPGPRVSGSAGEQLTGIGSFRWVCVPRSLPLGGQDGVFPRNTSLRTKHKAVPQPLPSVASRPKMLKLLIYTCSVDPGRSKYPTSFPIKTDPPNPLSRSSGFRNIL